MAESEALYNDAQANEILRTAVRLAAPGEITFEELALAAAELGISRDELKDAEAEYRKKVSEAGQREEFRHMQRHQLFSFILHIGIIALILSLIAIFDIRRFALVSIAIIVAVCIPLIIWRDRRLKDETRPSYERAYENWQRKKKIWLRPEDAREEMIAALQGKLSLAERLERGDPRTLMCRRLVRKFGYDKKRVRSIVNAYLTEHPEFEEQFGK